MPYAASMNLRFEEHDDSNRSSAKARLVMPQRSAVQSALDPFCTHLLGKIHETDLKGTWSVDTTTDTCDWMVPGPVALELYETLTGIQQERLDDPFNWVYPVL